MEGNFAGPARIVNVLLGIWLFLSAFSWPHTYAQRTDTWILGILAILFAFAAARWPAARFANTILAVCLFVSAFALRHLSVTTVWNNAIVAVVIFFLSLIPPRAVDASAQRAKPELPDAERRIPPPQQPQTV